MRKEGGIRDFYKNDTNNMQKRLVLIAASAILLTCPTQSTGAFYSFVQRHYQNSQLGEMSQLKYYMLDVSVSKNCPEWLRANMVSPATLSNEEFELMKVVLQISITRYNLKIKGYSYFQITGQYGVQYLPYIDKKGRKQIWVNGFCAGDEMYQKPETVIAMVFDGGSCFFNTLIRAGSRKTVFIGIHGLA